MRTTTYCYPWDLARLGVARSLGEIADFGIDGIDLAATYHPIDALSPRGGMNLYSDARGAVYFPAREAHYGRIKPFVHSPGIARAWPEAANEADRLGLGLNSWTITLFQPWIRDAHPDCARVMPWGDRSGSGVCAANPDVRDYVAALCVDLSEQFGVALFRLEGVLSHAFDLDWLRPRNLVTISPLARALSSLCFCDSCKGRAGAQGIDVAALLKRVAGMIEAEVAGEPGGENRSAAISADADLIAYTQTYVRASIELVQQVVARVGQRAQVSCNAITSSPRPLSALYVTVRNPTMTSAAQMAEAGADRMLANLQATADAGFRELSLYNFGLLPDSDVRAFMDAVGQLRLS